MNTLEEKIREKLATGYDPVTVNVSARADNGDSLEVIIEGVGYIVRGDSIKGPITSAEEVVATESKATLSEDLIAAAGFDEPYGTKENPVQALNMSEPEGFYDEEEKDFDGKLVHKETHPEFFGEADGNKADELSPAQDDQNHRQDEELEVMLDEETQATA